MLPKRHAGYRSENALLREMVRFPLTPHPSQIARASRSCSMANSVGHPYGIISIGGQSV